MNEEIKRCKQCGKRPELHYVPARSKALRELLNDRFAGDNPRYYISCRCGRHMIIETSRSDYDSLAIAKRKLVRRWNREQKKKRFFWWPEIRTEGEKE